MSSPPGAVTAVVVSHAGSAWLPRVLEDLAAQTVAPDAIVGVDTGGRDDSSALLVEALGEEHVVGAPRMTSYGDAVEAGLGRAREQGADPEWIWLLHDDSAPAPDALATLLAAARAHPEAAVLGPKLREWPSLRRLLELGVTISGTGRRETGLERGEYDQGQHDDLRRVLAVNTAGMLVRADVWEELGGLDPALPVFGNDLDFGWRVARAGHQTIVVPQALVFHAEAAHRGVRRTSLTGRHTHYQERRAALYTLLVNGSGLGLPWRIVRLGLGTVLRVLGFLLVRSIGEAADEAAAYLNILARPGVLLAARRKRAAAARVDVKEVRPLLAPWWLPYRHGLDFVTDLAEAATNQAQDLAERRRAAAAQAEGRAPTTLADPDDEDLLAPDSGWFARFVTSPVALALTGLVVALLVATRDAWGRALGGGLPPAPERATAWWRLYTEHVHALALGTDTAPPAYVAVLATLGTVLGGSGPAAVSALLLLSMPLALWGAWRLLRLVGRLMTPEGAPRWLVATASATYALTPAVSGVWAGGRIGPVVIAAVVPWLAHAMLGFADPEPDRRWRAAWRTGLLLTLAAAFGAAVLAFAVLLAVLTYAGVAVIARGLLADRSVSLPPLVALAVPVVLLLPWWLPLTLSGDAGGLLLDPGRLPPAQPSGWQLLWGRIDGGAPFWLGVPVLVAALAALAVRRSRPAALAGWTVVAVASLAAAVISAPELELRVLTLRPGVTSLLPLVAGGLVVAAFAGGVALVDASWGSLARVKRPLGTLMALAAVAVPVAGVGWFTVTAPGSLGVAPPDEVPVYMTQSSLLGDAHGVLVLRGSVDDGLTYLVRRGDGVTLGEDEILALTPEDTEFTAALQQLVGGPSATGVAALADAGIEYVVLPAPADGRVAAELDATTGLSQAGAENRSTRAWHVDVPAEEPFRSGGVTWQRILLLVMQGAALLVIGVLCGPTRRREGRR